MDVALADLDAAMENRDLYREAFMHKTDSIRNLYEISRTDSVKWEYARVLYDEYIHYSLDSAYSCLHLMKLHACTPRHRMLNRMTEVNVLYQKQMDDMAVELFDSIDTTQAYAEGLRKEYLTCAMYLFKNVDPDRMEGYRRMYIAEDTVSVFGRKIHAQYLRDHGDLERALEILLACDGTEDNYHDKTSTVYNIGIIYSMLGDEQRSKIYLARSGVYDFMAPNRDYASIYRLALELYEDGDLKRANRYIESNLMDAIGGNFDYRLFNSSKAHQVIAEANIQQERDRMKFMTGVLIVVSSLLLLLLYMFWYSRRQSCRLKETYRLLSSANSQVKKQNSRLREANLIKDNYVFRYMDLSIKYLEKLEQYKHDIRQELKRKPVDTVIKDLRNPSDIYAEYKKFYQIFDETFLSIFPDFREKVNELLKEECRIPVPEEKMLTTEQRILAVIRLGITESGKIASFLNCAPPTIYTYRTKMRNAAIVPKEEFEEKLRHL